MKSIQLSTIFLCLAFCGCTNAQNTKIIAKASPEGWTVYNREVTFKDKVIHLNTREKDGLLWLNDSDFSNGIIEVDIKGKDTPGQSFVGIAFHGQDEKTFDAVYFRPFNFKNPERSSNSVQYIAMPNNDWYALRNAHPGKYENSVNAVPDPVDVWFHVKMKVNYPNVKVYVNHSESPTLNIEQISDRRHGKVGLWVGNNSEGWFKDLVVISQ